MLTFVNRAVENTMRLRKRHTILRATLSALGVLFVTTLNMYSMTHALFRADTSNTGTTKLPLS